MLQGLRKGWKSGGCQYYLVGLIWPKMDFDTEFCLERQGKKTEMTMSVTMAGNELRGQKFGLIWVIKFFLVEVIKKYLNKKYSPNLLFFNEKKFREIRIIFDVENSLWKSNFRTLHWAGKARQSIPRRL